MMTRAYGRDSAPAGVVLARAAVLALLAFLAGCASPAPGGVSETVAPWAPGAEAGVGVGDAVCVTGRVGAEGLGMAARTVVASGDGGRMVLEGPLAPRVRLLTGATVTVCGPGPRPGEGPGAVLLASALELRRADGMEAHLGTVRRGPGGVELDPGPGRVPVPLSGALDGLPAEGGMVWVAGEWLGDRFHVLTVGALPGW